MKFEWFKKLISVNTTIIVNGKKVDPESKEGKRIMNNFDEGMKEFDHMMNHFDRMMGKIFK